MNTPVTTQQMKDFKESDAHIIGGKEVIGHHENGEPILSPNRRERRAYKQRSSNCKKPHKGKCILKNPDGSIKSEFNNQF